MIFETDNTHPASLESETIRNYKFNKSSDKQCKDRAWKKGWIQHKGDFVTFGLPCLVSLQRHIFNVHR